MEVQKATAEEKVLAEGKMMAEGKMRAEERATGKVEEHLVVVERVTVGDMKSLKPGVHVDSI